MQNEISPFVPSTTDLTSFTEKPSFSSSLAPKSTISDVLFEDESNEITIDKNMPILQAIDSSLKIPPKIEDFSNLPIKCCQTSDLLFNSDFSCKPENINVL